MNDKILKKLNELEKKLDKLLKYYEEDLAEIPEEDDARDRLRVGGLKGRMLERAAQILDEHPMSRRAVAKTVLTEFAGTDGEKYTSIESFAVQITRYFSATRGYAA